MKLYLLGVGPGDPELLTLKALRLIQRLPVLFYPEEEGRESLALRAAKPHIPPGKPLLPLPLFTGHDPQARERARRQAAETIREALARYGEGGYLVLGDSLLYASPLNLLPHLAGVEVEAVPGISAHQLAASRVLRPIALGEGGFAAVTGLKGVDPSGLDRFQSVFVYKAKDLVGLREAFPERKGFAFLRLGMEGERILPLERACEVERDYWTLVGLWREET
ncbi:SAM-dependent methyltransferase [Thermus brockianus]|uniref:Precorrin-2 methylase n=1 Tax=Thermus brockianus TaxID=56956 RepID=A0ABM7XMF6_THEBO|nr:precorrin-2 C(20)-methyltransferase [Thermus brockianus]BDG17539.1 precorrin-2 methylase [Thermus brockianus]